MRLILLSISVISVFLPFGCISSKKVFVNRQDVQGKWLLTNEAASDRMYYASSEQAIMILNDDNSCVWEYRTVRRNGTYKLSGNNLRILHSTNGQDVFDILSLKDGKMEVITSGQGFSNRNAKYIIWEKLE
jgi:hypothetical protein